MSRAAYGLRGWRVRAVLLVFLATQLTSAHSVDAQIGSDLGSIDSGTKEAASERRQSLIALRQELEKLDSELERINAQADDIVGRVARVRKTIEIQRLRVKEAQGALAVSMEGVGAAERELARLEVQRTKLEDRLRRRAGTLYRLGRWGYLRLFLSLARQNVGGSLSAGQSSDGGGVAEAQSSVADPLAGVRLLRGVVKLDAVGLVDLAANRREAEAASAVLEERRREARAWLSRQRKIGAQLEAQQRQERVALAALSQRQDRIGEQLKGATNRRDRLDRLLGIIGDEGSGGLGGLAIGEFKGALDWPVRGSLGRRFGPYRDRQYGTLVRHNGQVIVPPPGALVRAVYPGRVVYSGQFRDVGLVVVVQHSGDALTMYSGLRDVLVGEGDILGLGESLGAVVSELYFEIRIERKPEDPLAWLL